MKGNKIIAHTLIKTSDGYLVIKRSKLETTYPEYRETKEEVELDIVPTKIIHEDSNLDKTKDLIFIRLVYLCDLKSKIEDIILQEEHSEYRFIKSLSELKEEKVAPFLIEAFNNL